MDKISYSIKVSEEGRPTTLDIRQEDFKPLVEKYERRNIWNSWKLIFKNLRSKLLDHLLMGGEHTKKVSPGFSTPTEWDAEVEADEKREIVLTDPKFGMFSLFYYHVTRGYKNQELKKTNKVFCSHIFSLFLALPLLIFLSQWMLYVGLISHEINAFDGDYCPNKSTLENKLIIAATGIIYFVRSFFIWDNLTSRIGLKENEQCR